jgi:drug/metabolite transporter (DMT)-like permease
MIAVLGGIGAALAWGVATFASSRSSRSIGAASTLAWVSLIGLVVSLPLLAIDGPTAGVPTAALADLAVVGVGYIAGLLLLYAAMARGSVGIAAPIASTEGAIAALIAILLGEAATFLLLVALGVIVVGLVVATLDRGPSTGQGSAASDPSFATVTIAKPGRIFLVLSIGAAVALGVSLFAAGRVSGAVPLAWVVMAGRIVGVLAIAVPLVIVRRLRFDRAIAGWLVLAGSLEVAGYIAFALGARDGIAVAAVLASQFAIVATLCAAVSGERLVRRQWIGVGLVMLGVAAVALLQA